jgi:hypothetical protein
VKIRLRALTAVVALPLVLGVAACGAGQKTNSAGDSRPTPAPASSTAAPSKAATQVAHFSTASFLPAMKTAMSSKKSLKSTMRMVAGGQVMTISAVQTTSPVAMAIDMNGKAFGGKGRIVIVHGVMYVSMKSLTPSGKYVKVDTSDSSDPLAASVGSMLQNMDPTKTFDAFDGGLKNVKFVRAETIDGVRLDKYAVTVDTAAALRAQGQKMPAGMPKTVDYTIWMGADRLVHRVAFDLPGVSMVMNISGWGQPVTIKAPPASDIVTR